MDSLRAHMDERCMSWCGHRGVQLVFGPTACTEAWQPVDQGYGRIMKKVVWNEGERIIPGDMKPSLESILLGEANATAAQRGRQLTQPWDGHWRELMHRA